MVPIRAMAIVLLLTSFVSVACTHSARPTTSPRPHVASSPAPAMTSCGVRYSAESNAGIDGYGMVSSGLGPVQSLIVSVGGQFSVELDQKASSSLAFPVAIPSNADVSLVRQVRSQGIYAVVSPGTVELIDRRTPSRTATKEAFTACTVLVVQAR